MKKRESKKADRKVILFPNLVQRSLEKGLEYLQNKEYEPAVRLFEDALAYSPDNRDVYIGLLLAYYESGMYDNAKKIAKEMLSKGIGDYFDTVELYLMVLVQLQEYDEMTATIHALIEEQEIPGEKIAHFTKLVNFASRMKKEKYEESLAEEYSSREKYSLHLLETKDSNQLMLTIAELADKNVRPYIDEIKEYLRFQEGHPFLKTMLLSILKDQEYEQEIEISKFARNQTVIPSQLFAPDEHEQKQKIEEILQMRLEHENPVLLGQIKGLLERQLYLLYPFSFLPEDAALWAGAYHATGIEFNGENADFANLAEAYKVNSTELNDACQFIRKLEKISFPII